MGGRQRVAATAAWAGMALLAQAEEGVAACSRGLVMVHEGLPTAHCMCPLAAVTLLPRVAAPAVVLGLQQAVGAAGAPSSSTRVLAAPRKGATSAWWCLRTRGATGAVDLGSPGIRLQPSPVQE
jgi:hypothetical protein